jgi:hypothetical protein
VVRRRITSQPSCRAIVVVAIQILGQREARGHTEALLDEVGSLELEQDVEQELERGDVTGTHLHASRHVGGAPG